MACAACTGGVSHERKLELLERSPFFVYLNDEELETLARAFVTRKVSAGTALPNSPFYFVLHGDVEVRHEGRTLVTKHAGSFFSRHAGMAPRRTEAVAQAGESRRNHRATTDTLGGHSSARELSHVPDRKHAFPHVQLLRQDRQRGIPGDARVVRSPSKNVAPLVPVSHPRSPGPQRPSEHRVFPVRV